MARSSLKNELKQLPLLHLFRKLLSHYPDSVLTGERWIRNRFIRFWLLYNTGNVTEDLDQFDLMILGPRPVVEQIELLRTMVAKDYQEELNDYVSSKTTWKQLILWLSKNNALVDIDLENPVAKEITLVDEENANELVQDQNQMLEGVVNLISAWERNPFALMHAFAEYLHAKNRLTTDNYALELEKIAQKIYREMDPLKVLISLYSAWSPDVARSEIKYWVIRFGNSSRFKEQFAEQIEESPPKRKLEVAMDSGLRSKLEHLKEEAEIIEKGLASLQKMIQRQKTLLQLDKAMSEQQKHETKRIIAVLQEQQTLLQQRIQRIQVSREEEFRKRIKLDQDGV